jgi:hypothetical protein
MNFEKNGSRWMHSMDGNPRGQLNVFVAYEDFPTGNHALRMFERLFPGSGESSHFSAKNVWKFDLLQIAKFRDMAAAEAASADMIILSTHGIGGLPPAIKRWMELWVQKRQGVAGALVVLLDSTRAQRGVSGLHTEAYLEACAFRAGMDFFMEGVGTLSASHGNNRDAGNEENTRAPAFGKILPLFQRRNLGN